VNGATESPNRRISWSITLLSSFLSCLIFGLFASSRLLAITSGLGVFLIAVISGVVLALVVNLLRPSYESCPQRWRAFYDFLLRQVPPPD
jgi:predicted exporter